MNTFNAMLLLATSCLVGCSGAAAATETANGTKLAPTNCTTDSEDAGLVTGKTGTMGTMGAEGPEGPQGPQGPVGPQGPTGATGLTGAVGPAGASITGDTGAQGAPGPQGPQGQTGAQGIQGVSVQGPAGPVGPAGAGMARSSVYIVQSTIGSFPDNDPGVTASPAIASCANDTDILLTGWCVPQPGVQTVGQYWYGQVENVAGSPMAWKCTGVNTASPSNLELQAFATCVTAQ